MRKTLFPIVPMLLSSLVLLSCDKDSSNGPATVSDQPGGTEDQAVSARPTASNERFMTTVQLAEPALLDSRSMVAGELSEAAIEKVTAEHALFKEKLSFISPDIEIIYEYKYVLNGFSIVVPSKYAERLSDVVDSMGGLSFKPMQFQRVTAAEEEAALANSWGEVDSVGFIGAKQAHETFNIKGEGISVGVIDTGIDYTHKMFGGAGTPEIYAENDPSTIADDFPTAKVVGGYDFVGAGFNSASPDLAQQIPSPDPDPLDESGHGTHVAGTVAGIGDGVNTYSGVAPAATLHALKVFGRNGSTNDSVVIAALEYAADPNNDFDLSDRLDVVNLSLGGGYGAPNGLYDIAVKNLANGGTISVIAAGNSGDTEFIVGSPSTSAESISVAASVDAMDHNWREPASEIIFGEESELVAVAVGSINPPIEGFEEAVKLVDMGLATAPADQALAEALNGNFALIQRGENPFCEKGQYAQDAGAKGFVVYTNDDEDPITMGGECALDIPGVMISKAEGEKILASLAETEVKIALDSGKFFEFPERIDQITGFSSRGPRSIDALLKPEVSAPGQAIVSAAVGGGDAGIRLSGTSMAAPHIAGVAALIRQQYPNSSVAEVKSRMMNTAIPLTTEDGEPYPLSRQGAGRIDTLAAIQTGLAFTPAAVSFGNVSVVEKKSLAFRFEVTNAGFEKATFNLGSMMISPEWMLQLPRSITLAEDETRTIYGNAIVNPAFNAEKRSELDAYIQIYREGNLINQVAVHSLRHRASNLKVEEFSIAAGSGAEAVGAEGSVRITNEGAAAGRAFPFNLISEDERQDINARSTDLSFCDLESTGYRISNVVLNGEQKTLLEIAFKLYNPLTNWFFCQPTALIDTNADGEADYEVFGGAVNSYSTQLDAPDEAFSILANAKEMQSIRQVYDSSYNPASVLDFKDAILSVAPFNTYEFSTFATLAIDLSTVPGNWRGIRIKPGVLDNRLGSGGDDFISDYAEVFIDPFESSFFDFDANLTIGAYDYELSRVTKGANNRRMIVYYPDNPATIAIGSEDLQSEIIEPEFRF